MSEKTERATVIGVMSDTHGNHGLISRAARILVETLGAQIVYHLGDDYRDADVVSAHGCDVRRVPGLWCDEYHDSHIPRKIVEDIAGITVAAVHADRDLRHAEYAAGIILTGHTHRARIEVIGPSLYVNPGHLKDTSDREQPPTFASVSIASDVVRAVIHNMDGSVRQERTVERSRLA